MKRWMMAATILAVAMMALAGCGPQQDTDTGVDGTVPANAGEKTELRFLAMEYDTNTRPFMEKVESEFEAENPDVDLTIEVINWDQGFGKLSTLVSAGNAPDLANIATLWLPELVDLDVVQPLDEYVSDEFEARFIEKSLRGATYQDTLYGLPIAMSARALYCNTDLVSEPPADWGELVQVGQRATDRSQGIFGFGVQGAKVETDVYFYYFLWANGGRILNEDKTNAAFNEPAGVEALQFMVDLIHKYEVSQPDTTAYAREDLQEMFKAGSLGMMITGPWFWGMLEEDVPDLNYELAPIPAHEQQVTMAVTDNLVMFKSSQAKDAAWKFVEFFYDPELRLEWAKTFGMLPELKEVAESDYITESKQWSLLMSLLPDGKFVPLHPRWKAISEEIITGIQEAHLQTKTPQEALDDAATRVDEILAEG
jgi:multiple sugar transport system substrate-binding protein